MFASHWYSVLMKSYRRSFWTFATKLCNLVDSDYGQWILNYLLPHNLTNNVNMLPREASRVITGLSWAVTFHQSDGVDVFKPVIQLLLDGKSWTNDNEAKFNKNWWKNLLIDIVMMISVSINRSAFLSGTASNTKVRHVDEDWMSLVRYKILNVNIYGWLEFLEKWQTNLYFSCMLQQQSKVDIQLNIFGYHISRYLQMKLHSFEKLDHWRVIIQD